MENKANVKSLSEEHVLDMAKHHPPGNIFERALEKINVYKEAGLTPIVLADFAGKKLSVTYMEKGNITLH